MSNRKGGTRRRIFSRRNANDAMRCDERCDSLYSSDSRTSVRDGHSALGTRHSALEKWFVGQGPRAISSPVEGIRRYLFVFCFSFSFFVAAAACALRPRIPRPSRCADTFESLFIYTRTIALYKCGTYSILFYRVPFKGRVIRVIRIIYRTDRTSYIRS